MITSGGGRLAERETASESERERDEQDMVSVSISQRTVIEGAAGHH